MSVKEFIYNFLTENNFNYSKIINSDIYQILKIPSIKLKQQFFTIKQSLLFEMCLKHYKNISSDVYNRKINIIENDAYTVIKGLKVSNFYNSNKNELVYQLTKQLITTQKISCGDKILNLSDVVFLDFFEIKLTYFSILHTDLEYDVFIGNAFNIWYLIENPEEYGNMFLYETNQINTQCYFDDLSTDEKNVSIYKNTFLHQLLSHKEKISDFQIDTSAFKYLNISDGDCFVMSKNLPHTTDLRRTNGQVKGFNYRVLIRNDDSSIDINPKYVKDFSLKPHHYFIGNKLYGVTMYDFI